METLQVTWSFLMSFLFILTKLLTTQALCPQLPLSVHQLWLRLQPVAMVTPTQTAAHYWASLNRGRLNALMSQLLWDNEFLFLIVLFVQGKRRFFGGDCSVFTFQADPPWGRGAAGTAAGDRSGSLQGERPPKASEWSRGYISPAGTRSVTVSVKMVRAGTNGGLSQWIQLLFALFQTLPDDVLAWEDLDNGVRVRELLLKGRPLLKVLIRFPPLQSTESTSQRRFQIPFRASAQSTSTNSRRQNRMWMFWQVQVAQVWCALVRSSPVWVCVVLLYECVEIIM